MGQITFEQTQQDVVEIKKDFKTVLQFFYNKQVATPQIEEPLKFNKLIELTGYSKPTIYKKVRNCEIPHHKKGNRLYFFKSEIIEWIKESRVKTNAELDKEVQEENDAFLSKKRKS